MPRYTKHTILILLSCFLISKGITQSNAKDNLDAAKPKSKSAASESLIQKLQAGIDADYSHIDLYYRLLSEKELCVVSTSETTLRLDKISDSLTDLALLLSKLHNEAAKLSTKQKIDTIKMHMLDMLRWETEEARLTEAMHQSKTKINLLDSQLNLLSKNYKSASEKFIILSKKVHGSGSLMIGNNSYRFFVVVSDKHTITIHNSSKHGPASISGLLGDLQKNRQPLMITNAGMFTPSFGPQGLLIQDGVTFHELDMLRPVRSNLNFYLLPNGVFHITKSGEFGISDTEDFIKLTAVKSSKQPYQATQSGPLMLSKGAVNKNFRMGSANTNIRSGVGLVSEHQLVFLISDNPVNFYDFTLVFKEVFGCHEALYLDGAISQMYLNEQLTGGKNGPIDGLFGPLISVTLKK